MRPAITRREWIAGLTAFVSGCVRLNPRGSVTVDPEFTEAERAVIHEAFRRWSLATGGRVSLVVVNRDGYPIERYDRAPDTYGYTQSFPTGFIQLDPGRVGRSGLRTVMHELGHAFGLDHLDDPKSLMYFENNGVTEVDPATLRAFCEKWECPR